MLASKEGPGLGHAPVLEIDTTVVKTIEDAQLGFGIDVTKFADGSVTNADFQRLAGTIAPVQTQLNTLSHRARHGAFLGRGLDDGRWPGLQRGCKYG